MAITVDGKVYYKTLEACKETGISRATLFRWLKIGILEKYHKDRRGWRLFTQEDLNRIMAEARKIKTEDSFNGDKNDQKRDA